MRKEKVNRILDELKKEYPDAECALNHRNAFELLVSVVLSAQTTDKSVNQVTPALFNAYPDAFKLSKAKPEKVAEHIKRIGMYKTKSNNIVNLAKQLVEKHDGQVPGSFDELVELPGVGRKTANVIQSVAFGKATLAVDTHVFRVAHRMGLVNKTDNTPYKAEMALTKYIPEEDIPNAHHWLLLHGRYVCTARKPHCEKCELASFCAKKI